MLTTVLLVIHITGGVLALISGVVAIGVQLFKGPHRAHVVAGRLFVTGMIMVVVSALPLSVLISSVLLALIGVFSGYLMLVGLRLAKNRKGRPQPFDWVLDAIMLTGSVVMVVVGVISWANQGVVLVVFGLLGAALAGGHAFALHRGVIRGRERIATHLQFMFAAYIATLTAFLVVNDVFGIFAWFLPTVILTPLIIVWRRRVAAGAPTTLDRSPAGRSAS